MTQHNFQIFRKNNKKKKQNFYFPYSLTTKIKLSCSHIKINQKRHTKKIEITNNNPKKV
jgi:hypothetical protein